MTLVKINSCKGFIVLRILAVLWSIAVAEFLPTPVDLFIVGIMLYRYIMLNFFRFSRKLKH